MGSPYQRGRAGRPGGPVGWSHHHRGGCGLADHHTVAVRPTRVAAATRAALGRVLRRQHRRRPLTLGATPTQVHTARPMGARMGKGKGKPAGRYGWLPRGGSYATLAGRAPLPRPGTLTSRTVRVGY